VLRRDGVAADKAPFCEPVLETMGGVMADSIAASQRVSEIDDLLLRSEVGAPDRGVRAERWLLGSTDLLGEKVVAALWFLSL